MLHGKSIGFRSQALSMAHKTKAPADNEWPGPSRVHPPRRTAYATPERPVYPRPAGALHIVMRGEKEDAIAA